MSDMTSVTKIPEVIPASCGRCTYFKKTGIVEGLCRFYNVIRYSSKACLAQPQQAAEEELAPLSADEQVCINCGKTIKKEVARCPLCDHIYDPGLRQQQIQQRLEKLDKGRREKMRKYLRQSGVAWLFVAALQFSFSGFLSREWGVVCVVLGILNLALPHRPMLLINGIAMILVRLSNLLPTFIGSMLIGFWSYLGGMQVIWGGKEIIKFAEGDVQD